jgi:hypothetical protein
MRLAFVIRDLGWGLGFALLCLLAVSAFPAGLEPSPLTPLAPPSPTPHIAFADSGQFAIKVNREVVLSGWAGMATSGWKTWFTQAGARTEKAQARPDGGWNFIGWLGPKEPRDAALVSYSQTVLFASDTLGLAWQFRALREAEMESLHISLGLPVKRFAGRTLRFDDRAMVLPAKPSSPHQRVFHGRPERVAIDATSLGQVTLRFDGPQVVWVEDRRAWGGDDFELRIVIGAGRVKSGDHFGLAMQLQLPARAEMAVGSPGREFQNETKGWARFDLPWNDKPADDADKRVATDAARWLHAPAGRFGFLQAKDGRLLWPNGDRQKFWGVCCSWGGGIPAKGEAEAVAARMAKFGINMARSKIAAPSWGGVNIVDGKRDDSQHYDEQAMDEYDFFFDKLARRGIYTHLDLTWDRVFKRGDGIEIDQPDDKGGLYGGGPALYTIGRMAELVEKHADALLLRKNRYTGKRYVDDPALAIVQIVNENSMFRYPQAMPKAYARALEKLWAVEMGGAAPALVACVPREDGTGDATWTPRATKWLADIEVKFYQRLYRHLRKIGVKCPIATSNCALGMADSWAQATVGDVIEINAYWDHPHKDSKWVRNKPMVKSDGGFLRQFAAASVAGKPLLVTEVMNCGPNEHRAEGPLLTAAYAALQDWDGVLWFNYAESRHYSNHFEVARPFAFDADPARVGQFPAAARIFLGGLVAPARLTTHVVWSPLDLIAVHPWTWSGWWRIADQTPPTWLTFTSRWRNRLPGVAAPDPDIAIATARARSPASLPPKARVQLTHKPGDDAGNLLRLWVAAARTLGLPLGWEEGGARAFTSDTGELAWDHDHGRFTIIAPRCRAAVGFIGGQSHALGDVTIESVSPQFACITLVPLDDGRIEDSRRLLLTAVARAENAGQKWIEGFEGDVMVSHAGRGTLLEPVRARVLFHRKTPLAVFPLDPAGKRRRELSFGRATEGQAVQLPGDTLWYEVVGDTSVLRRLWPFGK